MLQKSVENKAKTVQYIAYCMQVRAYNKFNKNNGEKSPVQEFAQIKIKPRAQGCAPLEFATNPQGYPAVVFFKPPCLAA